MKKQPVYLYSLLAIFIIPTFIFVYLLLGKISIVNVLILAVIISILGSIWDVWGTKHGTKDIFWLWTFNEKYLVGVRVFDVPIEEYLLFFFGTTFIVTLWETINIWITTPSDFNPLIIAVLFSWTVAAVVLPKFKESN